MGNLKNIVLLRQNVLRERVLCFSTKKYFIRTHSLTFEVHQKFCTLPSTNTKLTSRKRHQIFGT